MLKKIVAGILGFSVALTMAFSPAAAEVSAAEITAGEEYLKEPYFGEVSEEEYLYAEEEIYAEDAGDFFAGETEFVGDNAFFDGGDGFSDGEGSGETDRGTEKTLEVTEGEDITEKLNAALLEMKDRASDKNMCKVIIPPGNYVITNTICTYSNIHLYAAGAVITKVSPEKHLMLRLGNTNESAGGYEGYRNVIIEGGTWDGNYQTIPDLESDGGFVMFRIGHATNVEIKNAAFLNNLKSHCVEFGGVKNGKVTGCTFRGYWKSYTGGGQEAIQIDACKDVIFPGYLPYDGTTCEDIYIEGNTFEDVFAGVGSHSMIFDSPYRNIVIRGNVFRDIPKRAVWCLNYVDSVVENNVMINVGTGVYARSMYSKNSHLPEGQEHTNKGNQYSSGLLIENNEITLNKPAVIGGSLWKSIGISVIGENCVFAQSGVPDGTYPMKGVTVKRNKISGSGYGIRLLLADNCRVSDNTVELTETESFENDGILVSGSSSNELTGNKIRGMKSAGIYVYTSSDGDNRPSKNNIISENVISAGGKDGILAGVSSDGTRIEKNTVSNMGGNGIRVWSNTGVTVADNDAGSCKENGILVVNGTKTAVSGNTVSRNSVDGIKTEKTNKNLSVKNNRCIKNLGAGMCICQSPAASVSGNEVVANKKNGIALRESADVVISKNNIRSNKGYAVIGTDSSVKTYSGNFLKNNDHTDVVYAINTSLPYSVKKAKSKK